MAAHVRLEETGGGQQQNGNYVIDDAPTNVEGENPNADNQGREKDGMFNCWKLATILLSITCLFLILALLGVFDSDDGDTSLSTDSGSGSGAEASTASETENDEATTTEAPDSTTTEAAPEKATYLTGETQPNIIFLLADDIGWADISHNGGQFDTPNIDAVLEDGVEFTKFYSHALCTPSRMAFLTGRYAWRLGVQYPEVIHGMMTAHVPTDEAIFSEVTEAQGYTNYYVGRWGVGYASWDFTPLGRGFEKFFGYFGPEGGYYNHSTDHWDEWMDVYDMWDNTEAFTEGNGTYSEDLFYWKTIEYLEEAAASGKPWTLTYASQTAHAPIDDDVYGNPPETWDECEKIVNDTDLEPRIYFCNKVKYLDMVWGNIIQYLKDSGLWDNTLIMMTTDNGGLPYTEQDVFSDWACNWPLRGAKVTHYEGGIHVWGGMTGGVVPEELRGTTHDGLTHIVDFAATAMRLSMSDETYTDLQSNEFSETSSCFSPSIAMNCKFVDGKNLYLMEEHDLIIHNVFPQYIPSWLHASSFDYAATDGDWKYLMGLSDEAVQATGWYKFPGQGVLDRTTDHEAYQRAGGNCTHGCVFYLPDDAYETRDLSDQYPEIQAYFNDIVQAIWRGGFDDDYHPGQNYQKDYRGWNNDNILRPYMSQDAQKDYKYRMEAVSHSEFNYSDFTPTWLSAHGEIPFENTIDAGWSEGNNQEKPMPGR